MDSEPDDYYEITSQLDAREILRYLNNLGIRNISGEVLKYFISDLKKLIKYDLQHRDDNLSPKTQYSEVLGPERLHTASTFSSRTRSKVQSAEVKCSRECERLRKQTHMRTVQSAPSLFQRKPDDNPTRRTCSCIRVDLKPDLQKEVPKSTVSKSYLKKLIKYDLQHRDDNLSPKTQYSEVLGPERLHTASTFSSRTRSKVQSAEVKCSRECERLRKRTHMRTVQSAPSLFQRKPDDNPTRRTCSCIRVDLKPDLQKEVPKSTVSKSLIKVPQQVVKRKSDPVSLYHYYTALWAKYKPNVPGENNWSDLRWNIRQKMVGSGASHTTNKPSQYMQQKHAVKKKPTTA